MKIYEALREGKSNLALVGLGYVGLPIAVAFSRKVKVIGFDLDKAKIMLYEKGIDPTKEIGDDLVKSCNVQFTSDESRLSEASFIVVAVPTPVNLDHTPDLSPVEGASRIIGRQLQRGTIVCYESTVYPGVTEDICVPILEQESGLKCGQDFKVAYSPERINPGDKIHRLENIRKIVSGMDEETLREVQKVYDMVIEVGTYPVSNIKTAEAIKVVENSQRDINIAFMNELAVVFDRMNIDTNEVVDGMNTKWNALGFRPGLVGGHCIGVDPYYFIYKAERLGYHSQIILNGRMVNDGMGNFVADAAIKQLIIAGRRPRQCKILIMGITFKENCPDIRNSKVIDIIHRLREYSIEPIVTDPWASIQATFAEYRIDLKNLEDISNVDCIIIAVAHDTYKRLSMERIDRLYNEKLSPQERVFIDVKGIVDKGMLEEYKYSYWRL